MHAVFDAEQETPELLDEVSVRLPRIHDLMESLRQSLPLVPNAGVGPIAKTGFIRIPNHYRSVSFVLPPDYGDGRSSPGVIVFKGTEPLLADFPEYFDWMMNAPFRASALPLALHFPLDMKLPPAGMWIEECVAEQSVSSRLQRDFLRRYGRLAKLPLPLFVFKMTAEQDARYEATIRARLPEDAMRKIKNKLIDGLGVEVYYYPDLPVRVADLMVGNVRETFRSALDIDRMEETSKQWIQLLAEMLSLGYMPYAPWHHGMGGCVDTGNVCIDGGFNDLLTLVPFEAIPDDALFRQSLSASVRMLSESMTVMMAASIGAPSTGDQEAMALMMTYVNRVLRENVGAIEGSGHSVDARLRRWLDPAKASDILEMLKIAHQSRGRRSTQYTAGQEGKSDRIDSTEHSIAAIG